MHTAWGETAIQATFPNLGGEAVGRILSIWAFSHGLDPKRSIPETSQRSAAGYKADHSVASSGPLTSAPPDSPLVVQSAKPGR
jgi:hypothetical protein